MVFVILSKYKWRSVFSDSPCELQLAWTKAGEWTASDARIAPQPWPMHGQLQQLKACVKDKDFSGFDSLHLRCKRKPEIQAP